MLMSEIKEKTRMNENISVDPSMDVKYKGKILFPENLERAKKHF